MPYGYPSRRAPFVPTPIAGNPFQIANLESSGSGGGGAVISPSGDVTGVTDANNINGAITGFGGGGGTVKLAPGNFYINASIAINTSGIGIVGSGDGHFYPTATAPNDTIINSLVNGPAILVKTPAREFVSNFVISNLLILTATAGASQPTGITVDSSLRGLIQDVGIGILGTGQIGFFSNPSWSALSSLNHIINNLWMWMSSTAHNSTGIHLTGANNSGVDTFGLSFTGLNINMNHTTQTFLHLGGADGNTFVNTVQETGAAMAVSMVNFDYNNPTQLGSTVPAANMFFLFDVGLNVTTTVILFNTGTPSTTGPFGTPSPNCFYGWSRLNGAAPNFVANTEIFGAENIGVGQAGTIGYLPSAGTAVVQSGTTGSPVTANAICGNITTVTASWTAGLGNGVQFSVLNTAVSSSDTVMINQVSGTTGANVSFVTQALATTNGFNVGLIPTSTATSLASLNFSVIKAVAS